jgi:hypothetical protein
MHLWTPLPPRRPEICAIKGVGTTSWFLLPISTCGAPCQSLVWEVPVIWGFSYCGENPPVLRGEVAQCARVELHV